MLDLLTYLVKYKTNKKLKRPDYLHKFLQFAVSNLNSAQQSQGSDWRVKEALLLAIGHLITEIRKFSDLKQMMEPMMIEHVLPELNSS